MKIKILQLFVFLWLSINISAQTTDVYIDTIFFNKDISKNIIVINQDIEILNTLYPDIKSHIVSGNNYYTFNTPVSTFDIGIGYDVTDINNTHYDLYFTQLPIINIYSYNTIVDEPKVAAQFIICESNGHVESKTIGVEYRGGTSQALPKKSFRIEFWTDTTGTDTENIKLLHMRKDDDWNIQAMYNEPLRLRSKVNTKLWKYIDTLYYIEDEPDAKNSIEQAYIELFLNNEYRGVYALSERIDRKQLKLKKFKNNEIKGELYKGKSWGDATLFTGLPPYSNDTTLWGGFEYKYPRQYINWENLYDFVDFVVNEDSINFYQEYHNRFDIDNAVNYFIFLNFLRALDNIGKNIFIARYKQDAPYFYVPWDLDATLGMFWDGSLDNNHYGILKNGFYERLLLDHEPLGFLNKLQTKWRILRAGIITKDSIVKRFETEYNYLMSNGVYERESIAWGDTNNFSYDHIQYLSNWLGNRLAYLDTKFNNLTSVIELDNNASKKIKIYPNPVTSKTVNIQYTNNYTPIKHIAIFNTLGQQVLYINNSTLPQRIDISNLQNGTYMLVVDFENGNRQIEKLLIQKH